MTRRLCVVCRKRPAMDANGFRFGIDSCVCRVCYESELAKGNISTAEWAAKRAWRYAKAEAKKKARGAK